MSDLKTRLEWLKQIAAIPTSQTNALVVLPYLLHDARLAHELTAQIAACQRERDWYKLLAWAVWQQRGEIRGSEARWFLHPSPLSLDADGLPIRTPALEAALLKAQEGTNG